MAKSVSKILLLILCFSLIFSSAAYTVSAEAASDTSKIRDIYMPETKIVNPPVVVQNVNTAEKLSKLYTFYSRGLNTIGWDKYEKLNIEFNDKVIGTRRNK
jgi:hypothetical protein